MAAARRMYVPQGFTTRKKVWEVKDVLHMLGEYARIQGLGPHIRLNTEVLAHEWSDELDRWIITVRRSQRRLRRRRALFCAPVMR